MCCVFLKFDRWCALAAQPKENDHPKCFVWTPQKRHVFPLPIEILWWPFLSPGGWKTVLLCCPRPSGAIGRSGCGKTGKWSPRHFLFFLRCRKRIRLGKTPGPAHKISPRVFFSQAIGQLVWKICPFNEHISSFKLYNYVYMQYHYRFELARQRVGALSLSSGEKICPVFLHPIETLERENGTAGWQLA